MKRYIFMLLFYLKVWKKCGRCVTQLGRLWCNRRVKDINRRLWTAKTTSWWNRPDMIWLDLNRLNQKAFSTTPIFVLIIKLYPFESYEGKVDTFFVFRLADGFRKERCAGGQENQWHQQWFHLDENLWQKQSSGWKDFFLWFRQQVHIMISFLLAIIHPSSSIIKMNYDLVPDFQQQVAIV